MLVDRGMLRSEERPTGIVIIGKVQSAGIIIEVVSLIVSYWA